MVTAQDYSALLTAEHNKKPLFVAIVELYAQWSVDSQTVLATFPSLFDLDAAVGSQLDALGLWVGFGRYIYVDASLGTVTLDDADYRTLLRAKILGNHWDGTNSQLQLILASLFPGTGVALFAVDNQDMSMTIYVTAGTLTSTQLALVKSGLLVPRPEGVLINGVIVLTGPVFGVGLENSTVSGVGVGSFFDFS